MYSVRFTSTRIERELQRLPQEDRARIVMALLQLEQNPRPSSIKALASNVYRLRVGRYRIICEVDDDAQEVIIGTIQRRSERTYQDWKELF